MWLCTRCKAHEGDLHRNTLVMHCVIWQLKFYKNPPNKWIHALTSKQNHFSSWPDTSGNMHMLTDVILNSDMESTTMPRTSTVVICYPWDLKSKCDSDYSKSGTGHFSFHFPHTGKFLPSLSSFIDVAAQFLCRHRWSLPLCQSAQLFTFSSCRRTFVVFATEGKVWCCPFVPLIYVVRGVWWINIKTRLPRWLPAKTGWLVSCAGLDCLPFTGFWDGEASGVAIQGSDTRERIKRLKKGTKARMGWRAKENKHLKVISHVNANSSHKDMTMRSMTQWRLKSTETWLTKKRVSRQSERASHHFEITVLILPFVSVLEQGAEPDRFRGFTELAILWADPTQV